MFYEYLLQSGVDKEHIIKIALDDRINKKYRDPDVLCEYVHNAVKDDEMYYVLLDEVQMVSEFEDVLNSFLHLRNVDTYVTGSNAKFLSKDIITEFRGRGDQGIYSRCLLRNICREEILTGSRRGRNIQCMAVYRKYLKSKMKKIKLRI